MMYYAAWAILFALAVCAGLALAHAVACLL